MHNGFGKSFRFRRFSRCGRAGAYFVKTVAVGNGDGKSWDSVSSDLKSVLLSASADFGSDADKKPVDVHVAKGSYAPGATLVLPKGTPAASSRVSAITRPPRTTRLDGFTIKGGSAIYGGGVALLDSSPRVVNTILWGEGRPMGWRYICTTRTPQPLSPF